MSCTSGHSVESKTQRGGWVAASGKQKWSGRRQAEWGSGKRQAKMERQAAGKKGAANGKATSKTLSPQNATPLLAVPSRCTSETIVVSTAKSAPENNGDPSTTISKRRPSTLGFATSKSLTSNWSILCLQLLCTPERLQPRRPRTPASAQTAR